MFEFLKFKKGRHALSSPSLGDQSRIYAVGDIHGRFDLLVRMLTLIAQDIEQNPTDTFQIILLGDLIDRGPRSDQIIRLLLELTRYTNRFRILKGNHEEVFLKAFSDGPEVANFFYDIGGRETLMSYGLDEKLGDAMTGEERAEWMNGHIPAKHVDFIDGFEDFIQLGDYLFVHAGIRPNVPIENQNLSDMRWIKREFVNFQGAHPFVIVHGHSIQENIDETPFRIGIDTGAYFTGRLSALVIEGTDRRYLQATAEAWDDAERAEEYAMLLCF